jgi:DNA-binding HxlR family transcriptional regulator
MALKMRKNKAEPMPPTCPLGECMAILGGAWTPNIVWYLMAGPRRFGELRADIPEISPKMLSTRLKDMMASGVVQRRLVPTSPPSAEYALTALGRELVPAIEAIVAIGHRLKEVRAAGAKSRRPVGHRARVRAA